MEGSSTHQSGLSANNLAVVNSTVRMQRRGGSVTSLIDTHLVSDGWPDLNAESTAGKGATPIRAQVSGKPSHRSAS